MTLIAQLQKLEPGADIYLFELDGSDFGADILRFHGHAIPHTPAELAAAGANADQLPAKSIWWQGNEYGAWPMQIQGIEANSDGTAVRPGGIYRCDIAAGGYQGLLQAPHGLWQNRLNSSGATTQIAIHYNAHRLFFRGINTGDFQEAVRRSDIVGSVAQASGVPTGAIIERGSNANGEYIKFADGTLICWRRDSSTTSVPITGSSGGMFFGSYSVTFPVQFVSALPSVDHNSLPAGTLTIPVYARNVTVASAILTFGAAVSGSSDQYISYIAIGRWY